MRKNILLLISLALFAGCGGTCCQNTKTKEIKKGEVISTVENNTSIIKIGIPANETKLTLLEEINATCGLKCFEYVREARHYGTTAGVEWHLIGSCELNMDKQEYLTSWTSCVEEVVWNR